MSEPDELSLSALRLEFEELRKDYQAFSKAYDMVTQRIMESTDTQPSRNPLLHIWSGSRAVCGSLELSIHAIERALNEYDEMVRKIISGEIKNSDKPVLELVDGGIE